jgi:hypothetical protein
MEAAHITSLHKSMCTAAPACAVARQSQTSHQQCRCQRMSLCCTVTQFLLNTRWCCLFRIVAAAGAGGAKESCAQLVKAAGGTLASRLPPATADTAAATAAGDSGDVLAAAAGQPIVLVPEAAAGAAGSCSKGQQQQQTQERGAAECAGQSLTGASRSQVLHAQQAGLLVLTQRWLADSVSSMQLLPLQGYRFSC